MKCLVVLSLLALAAANPGGFLGPYAAPYGAHLAAPYAASYAAPYAAHIAAPYAAAPIAVAHAAPVALPHAAPVAVAHAVAPVAVGVAASTSSQHHSQDTLGQYSYGYADRNSQKQEVRTADGITRGGYSYVDGHGIVQSANYVADGLGFRVAATNLPVGPAAPAAPFAAVAPYGHLYRKKRSVGLVGPAAVGYAAAPLALAAPAPIAVAHAAPIAVAAPVYVEPVRSFGYSTATAHADPVVVPAPFAVAHAAPVAVAAPAPVAIAAPAPVAVAHAAPVAFAPAVAVAPAISTSSQHQAQDTLGQYSYGYADRNSQKQEVRTADGITRGGYSYVDGHGLVQSASYVADGLGFRVAATNLPVGPAAP